MKECETLKASLLAAIAALEEQRATLGDAVVNVALESIREELAQLESQVSPIEQKRKLITVLFADVSDFTSMAEMLDAEDVTETMNALWARLDAAITKYGGQIDKHIGDCVMALWGVETAREDDPERAIRAALEIQAALTTFQETHEGQLGMRIGLNTGPVLLGEVGSTHEFTAIGDTVNLASRLEQAAPVGGVLISHDTYRHVRGIFDVQPQAPLAVKGKAELLQTYIVLRAKPRAFRMGTRGVEGIETRMVGRDAELLALQNAFVETIEGGPTHLVSVVGEAGVGKSRLLYEFENWLELRPEQIIFFKGRAALALQHVPYSVFHDLFADRFNIQESDGAAATLEKFRAGMADILDASRADLVGHLVGFDFSASPAVQNLIGSPDFGKLARAYLTNYVRTLAQSLPLVIFLEDLHWADDSSLFLIAHLVETIPQARLLLLGLARRALLERHPQWGDPSTALRTGSQATIVRLELKPLSEQASQALVDEILQKASSIPPALRNLIVENAEGNPFYLEELVKMLIDEEVIVRGAQVHNAWRVNLERLQEVRVPPTLTGILQARLDSLPHSERELLQRAAVVGRLFWDAAVAELADAEQEQVGATLTATCSRELIFQRDRSAFAGTQEYIFKHALLRDVAYETVLLKLRRGYHAQVARWLEAHAGERIGEYAGLIAEHLERAGQIEQAASYRYQSAQKALATGAFQEALEVARRALILLPEDSPRRTGLLMQETKALMWLGDFDKAIPQLKSRLAAARQVGDAETAIETLDDLGLIAREQGNFPLAQTYLEQSLVLAHQNNDQARVAHILLSLGWVAIRQGLHAAAQAHLSESQILYQTLGDRHGLTLVFNGLGMVALGQEDYEQAQTLYLQSLAISRQTGARRNEAVALGNLGEAARLQGDYLAARQYTQQSLDILQEIGSKANIAVSLANLGHTALALGDDAAAISCYHQALQISLDTGTLPNMLDSLAGLAGVLAHHEQPGRALELLGLVCAHPALDSYSTPVIEQVLADLRAQLPTQDIDAGLARGKALQLETVVTEILNQA